MTRRLPAAFKVLEGISVGNFVRLGPPFSKSGQGLFPENLPGRQLTVGDGKRDFAVEKLVIKPCLGGILSGGGIVYPADARPIDGAQAHRTRLATRVDLGGIQAKTDKCPAGTPN